MIQTRWTVLILSAMFWTGCVGTFVEPDDDTVGDDDVADDDVADDDTVADDDVADDDDSGESAASRCWTTAPIDGQLAVLQINVDVDTYHEVGRYGSGLDDSFHTAGIAELGDELIAAGYDGNTTRWTRIDRVTGETEIGLATAEWSVAATPSGNLATFCGGGYCEYASFDALQEGWPVHHANGDYLASRLAVEDGQVYGAWHSTSEIEVYDRLTGALLRTVPLEGWDGWVWGIGVHDGLIHLLDGDFSEPRVARFDGETGELLAEVVLENLDYDHKPTGLWCGPTTP